MTHAETIKEAPAIGPVATLNGIETITQVHGKKPYGRFREGWNVTIGTDATGYSRWLVTTGGKTRSGLLAVYRLEEVEVEWVDIGCWNCDRILSAAPVDELPEGPVYCCGDCEEEYRKDKETGDADAA
jgi:hypothetical protein